jgi:hypothetical protein
MTIFLVLGKLQPVKELTVLYFILIASLLLLLLSPSRDTDSPQERSVSRTSSMFIA